MSRLGQMWDDAQPCGTEAAYQRHRRRGERACYPCLQANGRTWQDREAGRDYRAPKIPDPRPVRNGMPGPRPYVRGAHRPAWALRAILAAEAEHGSPDDTPAYDDGELLGDLLAAGYARKRCCS